MPAFSASTELVPAWTVPRTHHMSPTGLAGFPMRNQLPRASRATRIKRLRPQIYFAFITLLGVKRAEVHRILGQRNLRSIQLFGEQLQILVAPNVTPTAKSASPRVTFGQHVQTPATSELDMRQRDGLGEAEQSKSLRPTGSGSVSYTHLTLPTKA